MRSWLLLRPKRPRNQSQTSIPASKAGSAAGASRANGWASSAMSPRPFTRSKVSESRSKLASCAADEVMDQRDAAKSQGIGHAERGDELQEATQDQQHDWRDDGAQHQAHTR